MGTQGVYGAPVAKASLLATSMFTYVPNSVIINTLDVVPNYEQNGAICQRSGKWYPQSQLVRDGTGLLVGWDKQLDQGWDGWPY